jgi:hypothetical protein
MQAIETPANYPEQRDAYLKEREFLENLMNTRFNFLLVVYGIVIAGAAAAKSNAVAHFVLVVGFSVCGALAFATYRAYAVALPLIRLLKGDVETPLSWASAQADRRLMSMTAIHIIGIFVPIFCVATLAVAWIGLNLNCWTANEPDTSKQSCLALK